MSGYGCLPWAIAYDEFVGLVMNLDRVRYQRAIEVLLGTAAAARPGPLAPVWFDALARHESQADGLEWETNSRRAEAAALAKGRPA